VRVLIGKRGVVLTVAALWLAGPSWSWAQEGGPVLLKLRGFAQNMTGVGHGRSGDIEVAIERWSSDAERDRVRQAMADSGVSGVTGVLLGLSPRVGYFRTERGGTADLKFARELPAEDGGRRIVLATGRVDAPADGSRPQADTHEFIVVEIRLDKAGKGEGRTAGAERLRYNQKTKALELDRYGAEPVWLDKLQVVTK
jgi:hypothetical protein